MESKYSEKEWLDDFQDFVNTKPSPAPKSVSDNILFKIKTLLNPSPYKVFFKLFGIHAFVGTLSLTICDQFGLNPFNTSLSLAQYFMTFGHSICMILCGAIFISFSLIAAWVIFSREEYIVLKNNYFLQSFVLSSISLAVLVTFGAQTTLGIGILWIVGAVVGGIIPVWILSHTRVRFV